MNTNWNQAAEGRKKGMRNLRLFDVGAEPLGTFDVPDYGRDPEVILQPCPFSLSGFRTFVRRTNGEYHLTTSEVVLTCSVEERNTAANNSKGVGRPPKWKTLA